MNLLKYLKETMNNEIYENINKQWNEMKKTVQDLKAVKQSPKKTYIEKTGNRKFKNLNRNLIGNPHQQTPTPNKEF